MYCDKDNRGRYAIMELTQEDFEMLNIALVTFRQQVAIKQRQAKQCSNSEEQFNQYDESANRMLTHIEAFQNKEL